MAGALALNGGLTAARGTTGVSAGVTPAGHFQYACGFWADGSGACYLVATGAFVAAGASPSGGVSVSYLAGGPGASVDNNDFYSMATAWTATDEYDWEKIEPGEVVPGPVGDSGSMHADVARCRADMELRRDDDAVDQFYTAGPSVDPRSPSVYAAAAVTKVTQLDAVGRVCPANPEPESEAVAAFTLTVVISGASAGSWEEDVQQAIDRVAEELGVDAPDLPDLPGPAG
jgi:hypothetical protein